MSARSGQAGPELRPSFDPLIAALAFDHQPARFGRSGSGGVSTTATGSGSGTVGAGSGAGLERFGGAVRSKLLGADRRYGLGWSARLGRGRRDSGARSCAASAG